MSETLHQQTSGGSPNGRGKQAATNAKSIFSPFINTTSAGDIGVPFTSTSGDSGGLSAASSRRPSYAAEFSSRPRLLDLTVNDRHGSIAGPTWLDNPSFTNKGQKSSPTTTSTGPGGPTWGLWSSKVSPPNNNTVKLSDDFSIPLPPNDPKSSKTYRSLSFSHPKLEETTTMAGSHLLETPYEEANDKTDFGSQELIDRLSSINLDSTGNNFPPSATKSIYSLFNDNSNGGAVGTIGESSSSLWFGQQQQQQQQQQDSRRHSYAGEYLAYKSGLENKEPLLSNTLSQDVDCYFSVDELGRNALPELDLNGSPITSNGSPISPTLQSMINVNDFSSLISVPSKKLYYVQFKAARTDVFFIPDNSDLVVNVNDLVIVDADRGRDLGKVIKDNVSAEEAGMLKLRRHLEQQAILQHNPNANAANTGAPTTPGVTMPKQILRFAQANEIQQIPIKEQDEGKAVAMCVQKVAEKKLAMSVLDAEYQWDRRKLTFFYSASHRIDFRDLVRDLFRIYKTRIWMCAVNPNVQVDQPSAQHHEYGLANQPIVNRSILPPRYPQPVLEQHWQRMPMNYSHLSMPPPPPQSAMTHQHMPPSPGSFSSGYPAKFHDPPLPPPPPPGHYWHVPN